MEFKNFMNGVTNDDRIFSREEIGNMSKDEYSKNEKAINYQWGKIGIPTNNELKNSSDVVHVNSYTRGDGGFSVGRRVSVANPARKLEWDVTPTTTRIIQEVHL